MAVRIINSGWLRLKINTAALAPGVVLKNSVTAAAVGGANPNFRLSLAGTVFSPSIFPPRVNLAEYQASSSSTTGASIAGLCERRPRQQPWLAHPQPEHPYWVELSFPLPVTVRSAQIYSGIDDAPALANFKVQYFSGGNWLDVPDSSVAGNTSTERNVIFSSSVTADRFRLYTDDNGVQNVKEFALFPPQPESGQWGGAGLPNRDGCGN